jgi:hypothetical protein
MSYVIRKGKLIKSSNTGDKINIAVEKPIEVSLKPEKHKPTENEILAEIKKIKVDSNLDSAQAKEKRLQKFVNFKI